MHEKKSDNLQIIDTVEEAQELIAAFHKQELQIREERWNTEQEKRKQLESERRKRFQEKERPKKEMEQLKRQVASLKKQNQGLKTQVNSSLLRRRREKQTVIVSDAGIDSINGTYVYARLFNSKPLFKNGKGAILYFREFWKINDIEDFTGWLYYNSRDLENPPEDSWLCAQGGVDFEPPPKVVNSS